MIQISKDTWKQLEAMNAAPRFTRISSRAVERCDIVSDFTKEPFASGYGATEQDALADALNAAATAKRPLAADETAVKLSQTEAELILVKNQLETWKAKEAAKSQTANA